MELPVDLLRPDHHPCLPYPEPEGGKMITRGSNIGEACLSFRGWVRETWFRTEIVMPDWDE